MRKTWAMVAILAFGCGGEPSTTVKRPSKPAKGDKVIVEGYLGVWASRDQVGTSARTIGQVSTGDLIEVDENFVGINLVRDRFGEAPSLHGYVTPWWKARP